AFRRDAGAIVAHPDLDFTVEIAGRHLQDRTVASFAGLLRGRVEGGAQQVQKYAGDVLRHDLDRRKFGIEVPFHRDVEALIVRTGTVIGEVERLLDNPV